MFRDDRQAMVCKLDVLDREAESLRSQNAAMREQLLAVRRDGAQGLTFDVYRADVAALEPGYRAALAWHRLTPFPAWVVAILHLLTFGIFPLIHFGMCHDNLPRAHPNDPSSAKAIGFAFIPYFNLYWVFFSSLRLADRINLQLRLRGLQPMVPRGLMIATSIMSVIPYVNILLGFPIMWTIAVCYYQRAINRLALAG